MATGATAVKNLSTQTMPVQTMHAQTMPAGARAAETNIQVPAVPVPDAVPYAVLLELPSAAVSLLPRPQATAVASPTAARAKALRVLAVTSPRRLRLRQQTCAAAAVQLLKPRRLQLQQAV